MKIERALSFISQDVEEIDVLSGRKSITVV